MSKTKVLLLTTDFHPNRGGIAHYLDSLISSTNNQLDWRVLTNINLQNNNEYSKSHVNRIDTRQSNHHIKLYPLRKISSFVYRLNRNKILSIELIKELNNFNPQHVVVGRWCAEAHQWCKILRKSKISYSIIAHGLELTEEPEENKLVRLLIGPTNKDRTDDFKSSKIVFANSQATSSIIENLGCDPSNIFRLPPGLIIESLPIHGEFFSKKILASFGISKPYILCLGRLVKRKGFDLAIKAFSRLSCNYPDTRLVIAGNGPEFHNLSKLASSLNIENKVIFTGDIQDEAKCSLFENCLFYMMPNVAIPGDMEGFGIVFLEAARYKKAVIGGKNGGVPDAVIDNLTGLLIDTNSEITDLTDAIEKLSSNEDLRIRLGNNGYARLMKNFQWSEISKYFINAITKKNEYNY